MTATMKAKIVELERRARELEDIAREAIFLADAYAGGESETVDALEARLEDLE